MAPKEMENEDDLKLFLEMRSYDKENTLLAHDSQEDFNDKSATFNVCSEASLEHSSGKPWTELVLSIGDVAGDDFLNSEAAKTDYDWLISSPATPLFPSLDMEPVTKSESTEIRILNPKAALSNGSSSYNAGGKRRPSSSSSSSSRPATPTTARATFPAIIKSSSTSRPSTPMARSSTPTTKSKFPSLIKPSSRSITPAAPQRRSSAPSSLPIRGISPSVKLRPLKTSDVSNSKPVMAQRPSSAGPRSRKESVSKTIVGNSILVKSRAQMDDDDDVNPVLMGTMMVERVVNMRKLAPPRQNHGHKHTSSYSSSSSVDSSGFGRSLSKKSLDMAIRHMDIRRSISGISLGLIKMNNGQNSSVQSTSSSDSSSKSREEGFSDSPLATSSSSSCEPFIQR